VELKVAGRSKSEAGEQGRAHENKMSILQDIECRTMFHSLRFKYMIIHTVHEATRLHMLWVEWLYYMGGRIWWMGSVVFRWVVHYHNVCN